MKHRLLTLACVSTLLLSACSGAELLPDLGAPQAAATIPHFPTLPPTWTPAPTDTPAPPTLTYTPRPSATPLPSTPTVPFLEEGTPAGTSSVLPAPFFITPVSEAPDYTGWREIQSETASFWLPETFVVADLGEFGELMELMMVAFTQGLVETFSAMVTVEPGAPSPTPLSLEEMQAAFKIDLLMALDESVKAAVFLLGEPVQSGTTLESQMASAIESVEGPAEVLRHEVVIGSPYLTARAFVRTSDIESGRSVSQLIYVFLHGERAWTISYQAETAAFEGLLPIFERSAQSFVARP